ncbi:MAG: leucine zipper domain-containing protein, partial [Actinomycetota bacterium]
TAAKVFMVSPPTARKWATRFQAEGPAGMADRSSRPSTMPTRTPPAVMKQIAEELRMPASTVHAVLVRCRINRLARLDRVTGEPIRRYGHPHPGSLIHVEVTKFGRIPDGGGHRFVGRQQGMKHRAATSDREGTRDARYQPRLGVGFLHTVIDDHSRFAYVEMHSDERSQTAIAVLRRAVAHFA